MKEYSNTSQTRGSKLAKFSNSRFLSLFFTSKLAVPLCSTQIREFGGITVLLKGPENGFMEIIANGTYSHGKSGKYPKYISTIEMGSL